MKSIAVLDRTKEPGSLGEPLYQDVLSVYMERYAANPAAGIPRIIGGRYGLSSKEFTPAMVKAVFDELRKPEPQNHFTIGIHDDVTHTSLAYDPDFSTEDPAHGPGALLRARLRRHRRRQQKLHQDHRQGIQQLCARLFCLRFQKSRRHHRLSPPLRPRPDPLHLSDQPRQVSSPATSSQFLDRIDVLSAAEPGATFLLNAPFGPDEIWNHIPRQVQETILKKKLRFYVIDAYNVAREAGMGSRINTIMQTCFFAISGVLPRDEAIAAIKKAILDTYGKRGEAVVQKNYAAVDQTLAHLGEVQSSRIASPLSSTCSRPSLPARRFSCAMFSAPSSPATAIRFPSAPADRRHLSHRHRHVGKAQHCPANSRVG